MAYFKSKKGPPSWETQFLRGLAEQGVGAAVNIGANAANSAIQNKFAQDRQDKALAAQERRDYDREQQDYKMKDLAQKGDMYQREGVLRAIGNEKTENRNRQDRQGLGMALIANGHFKEGMAVLQGKPIPTGESQTQQQPGGLFAGIKNAFGSLKSVPPEQPSAIGETVGNIGEGIGGGLSKASEMLGGGKPGLEEELKNAIPASYIGPTTYIGPDTGPEGRDATKEEEISLENSREFDDYGDWSQDTKDANDIKKVFPGTEVSREMLEWYRKNRKGR